VDFGRDPDCSFVLCGWEAVAYSRPTGPFFLIALFLFADLSKKLDRTERKVDEMAKTDSLAERTTRAH
jgi:hypothetical protein